MAKTTRLQPEALFFGHGDRSADSERNIESVTEKCTSATIVEMLEAFEAGIVTV